MVLVDIGLTGIVNANLIVASMILRLPKAYLALLALVLVSLLVLP